MALGINTNVASLSAQNQLGNSQRMNDQALERLSSGLRINSAKDDAAGLAISTRFSSQISGLNVAQRNANDGISLAQTTEGALEEITNNLQRIRELAVQSSNATNSTSDREALNNEVQQRISEIDRIASQTSFNGLKVLDGSFGAQNFQVGANAGEVISLDLTDSARSGSIGGKATLAASDLSGVIVPPVEAQAAVASTITLGSFTEGAGGDATSDFDITFTSGSDTFTASVANSATVSNADIAGAFEALGFNADGTGSEAGFTLDLGAGNTTITEAVAAGTLTVNRADGADFTVQENPNPNGDTAYTTPPSFNATGTAATTVDNGTAEVTAVAGTPLTLAADDFTVKVGDSEAISVTGTFNTNEELVDAINSQVSGVLASVDESGALSIESAASLEIAGNNTTLTGTFDSTEASASGSLDSISISSIAGSNDAILRADSALNQVNDIRGELGAIQNRFESTIANLATSVENLSASNSRILDADFAAETAKLSKSQVLQQAGISVLAQANARPQQVLSLLQ